MRLARLAALALAALLPALAPAQDALPADLAYLTFNIGGGAVSDFDLPRAARTIKDLGADFVALQEVDQYVGRNRNPKRDTAGDLAKAAGYPFHHFAKAIDLRGGEYGIALLSKHKPLSVKVIPLPKTNEQRVLSTSPPPPAKSKPRPSSATSRKTPPTASSSPATSTPTSAPPSSTSSPPSSPPSPPSPTSSPTSTPTARPSTTSSGAPSPARPGRPSPAPAASPTATSPPSPTTSPSSSRPASSPPPDPRPHRRL